MRGFGVGSLTHKLGWGTWVKNSALPPIIRDVVLLGLGSFLLLWQTVVVEPGKASALIIGAGLACLGITTGFGIKNLREAGKQETPVIPPSSSSSASASSPQQPLSS